MRNKEFKEVFCNIWQIKKNVVKLNRKDLRKYKENFYSLNFSTGKKNALWEFIWGDISYDEVLEIIKKAERRRRK